MPHLGVEEGEESEEEVGAYQIGEVEGDVPPWNKDFIFQQIRLSSIQCWGSVTFWRRSGSGSNSEFFRITYP